MPSLIPRTILEKKVGRKRSSICDLLNEDSPRYDASFPKPIKTSNTTRNFWVEEEVDAWVVNQIEISRGAA